MAYFLMLTRSEVDASRKRLTTREDLCGSRCEQVSAVHQQPEHQSEPSFLVSRRPPSMIAASSTPINLQDDCGKSDARRHDSKEDVTALWVLHFALAGST